MSSNRSTSIVVGALILFAYAVLAGSVLESTVLVMIFEVLSGAAVVAIAVLMFPLFRPSNRPLSGAYLALKCVEGIIMIVAGASLLTPGTSINGARDGMYVVHAYVFIVSAFLFYILLYKSRIVPRFFSVWGAVACVSLLIGNILENLGNTHPSLKLFYLLIVANEVFLALWLIIKGFDQEALSS